MRNFYRILQGAINTPLMVEIMSHQDKTFDADGKGLALPHDALKMAKAVLQLTDGTALISTELHRVHHDAKWVLPTVADDMMVYLSCLAGQVMCLVGDECPPFNPGEVWWIRGAGVVINKSGDDAILLKIEIRRE